MCRSLPISRIAWALSSRRPPAAELFRGGLSAEEENRFHRSADWVYIVGRRTEWPHQLSGHLYTRMTWAAGVGCDVCRWLFTSDAAAEAQRIIAVVNFFTDGAKLSSTTTARDSPRCSKPTEGEVPCSKELLLLASQLELQRVHLPTVGLSVCCDLYS